MHPDGYPFHWLWLQFGCLAFMGGLLGWVFLKNFNATRRSRKRTRACSRPWASDIETPEEIAATTPTTGGQPMNPETTNANVPSGMSASVFIVASFLFAVFVVWW